jgi:beta-glucosidase
VVLVMGEPPYAEMRGDRSRLDYSDYRATIAKFKEQGKSVITILLSGRPLIVGSSLTDSKAFIAAWLPGTEGQGVADLLFGDAKFTGKLPRTWPASNDHVVTGDMAEKPLFPLGFGLSD